MQAAADALAGTGDDQRPALLGVTVLTSLTEVDMADIASADVPIADRVVRLADLAWRCGCDGVVCAPTDLEPLRRELGSEPLTVTPGIRPPAADHGDQRRVATPAAAMTAGADFLVIGRPITGADDPGRALEEISRELKDL
jgi:orotidine-5'-phosphate decarboxylase